MNRLIPMKVKCYGFASQAPRLVMRDFRGVAAPLVQICVVLSPQKTRHLCGD